MPPQESAFLYHAVVPLEGGAHDHDALLRRVGDARFVLLGEATHGTHEFYRERAALTQRLITEKGFHAVAIEGDWPDAFRVNRFVRGEGPDEEAVDALAGFERFPTWMWRNADVLDFVGWLRTYNDGVGPGPKVGFYGLDLYSLYRSIQSVLAYLDRVDPDAAARARARYACFERFEEDGRSYAYVAGLGLAPSCEDQVVAQLVELRTHTLASLERCSKLSPDDLFAIEQNARVVANAEQYYRKMFGSRALTWNLRDRHMVDTLLALADHLDARVGRSKIVVWEHNSHVGDARATQMSALGEVSVGQLLRERVGAEDVVLVGFTTYAGTVTAASMWDGPAKRMRLRPALDGSVEALFHDLGLSGFWLDLANADPAIIDGRPRLERAVGVVYSPATERASHYFEARVGEQFDFIIHLDETRAVEPLERFAPPPRGDEPETYPFAV